MKRVLTLVAVFLVVLILLSSTASAQSKEEAENVLNEAYNLQENAKSSSDLEAALDKYSQAVGIFKKIGQLRA